MASMEVSDAGFPFENGDTVCLCSFPGKPNLAKDGTGWNLGVNAQTGTQSWSTNSPEKLSTLSVTSTHDVVCLFIVLHNCGQGKRARWQVIRHPDGKISFQSKVGDGKKNIAGTDGWHIGIKEDGTVIGNAGQGPIARFTPVAIQVPTANPVEG